MAKLARMIVALQSQAAKVGTAPQLPNSAIVDGTLDLVTLVDTGETDADGDPIFAEVVQAQLGTQEDGSQTLVVLEGPEPPAPTGGQVIAGPGSITVGWSGGFADDAPATLDHDYVAVHVAEKADVDGGSVVFPSNMTMMGTIRPLLGGQVTLARPAGVPYYVGLVSVTQAGKWSTLSDVLTVTPLDVAATGANGKPILWGTVAEMEAVTVPWVDGSTWFNEDAGNAPNVWRDGAWVAATFNDGAIGNLNVAKLVGDTITGNFVVAGRFETALVGGVKMDAAGVRVYNQDNELRTALNSDGTSTFRGQVEASGVEVLGKLKFHGPDSEVAAGARLNITGGVTAPTTSPNVYAEWPTVTLTGVPKTTITGVTRDPANGDWIVASINSTGAPTATRHDAATGALKATLGTFPTPTGYQYPANGGIAFVGGVAWVPLFVNEYSDLTYWTTTQIAATDGTRKTVLAKSASYMWSEGQRIAIGYASPTQVAVALYDFTRTSSKSRLLLFTPSTAAASGNVACDDVGMAAPPVAYGTFDFGAARFVLDATDTVKTYLTTGAAESANNFRTGRSVQSVGVGWYGGAFWTAGTDGKCYTYDGPNVGAVGAEFAATWYDSKSAGTGVHETPLGPSGWSETGISRARLRVHPPLLTLTDGDDGVDSVRIYARVGADMRLQGALSSPGATLLITGALASGTVHGSVADFPATSPGYIQNASGDIVLPGNGQAQLRGLNLPVSLTSETITNLPHGLYLPSDAGLVTTARGYPLDGVLGMLEVVGYVTGSGLMHRYTTLEATPRVFTQALAGSWSAWVQAGSGGSSGIRGAKGVITAQHTLSNNWNRITGYTKLWDTESMLNASTGLLVCPAALPGVWALNAAIMYASASTGRRFIQIEKGTAAAGNAANTTLIRQEIPPTSTSYPAPCVYTEVVLAAGDTISLSAYQSSGGNLEARADLTPTTFSARYLGPTP